MSFSSCPLNCYAQVPKLGCMASPRSSSSNQQEQEVTFEPCVYAQGAHHAERVQALLGEL